MRAVGRHLDGAGDGRGEVFAGVSGDGTGACVVEGVDVAFGEFAVEGHVALFAGGDEAVVGLGDGFDVREEVVGVAWRGDFEVDPVRGLVAAYWLACGEVVELWREVSQSCVLGVGEGKGVVQLRFLVDR